MADHLPLADPRRLSGRRRVPPPRSPSRNPRQHGRKLENDAEQAIAVPRARIAEGIDPRRVFKIRTAGRVADPMWTGRGLDWLGESADGWVFFVISADPAGQPLLRDLQAYAAAPDEEGAQARFSSIFGLVEAIEPYGPADRLGPGVEEGRLTGATVLDVELWPSPDIQAAEQRLGQARAVIDATEGEEIAVDPRPQFTILRARLTPHGFEAMLDLAVVERIRRPPLPYVDPTDWLTIRAEDLSILPAEGEPIGVLDDEIASGHPLLRDVVVAQVAVPPSGAYPWQIPGQHGTMVAGLAAYGDFERVLREGGDLRPRPVYGARVLEPAPNVPNRTRFAVNTLEHVAVEDAIRVLYDEHGVRIFNLSFTDEYAYSGPHVSPWTESLDVLIRALGVVCVVAAGNVLGRAGRAEDEHGRQYLGDYPDYCFDDAARVAEPSVAALALTVGSVARSAGPATPGGVVRVADRAIAEVEELSPFSRTGPGARVQGSVKPDLVHYGGNWVLNDAGRLQLDNPGVGVVTLAATASGRLFAAASGTSFAAPRVARLAADIWTRYPGASSNLVRALCGLSAVEPAGPRPADLEQRMRAYGYGRPRTEHALESGGNRVVLYYEGDMDADSVVVHEVPVPIPFAMGRSSRRFRVALAYDPPVRRQRREYLAGRMKFDLLRNVPVDSIFEIYGAQGEDREPIIGDRRRTPLQPGTTSVDHTTLHVREWCPKLLNPDDPEVYHLVVTHRRQPWAGTLAQPYVTQRYAVCIELVDEARVDLDLYAMIEQLVEIRPEVRLQTRR